MKFRFVEPLSPSATLTGPVRSHARSSSVMVPSPLKLVGSVTEFVRATIWILTVSSGSSVLSPSTSTVIVLLVSPAANVKVRGLTVVAPIDLKSVPEVAVDCAVTSPYATSTCRLFAVLRLTVKFMFVEPVSPSITVGESMETIDVSSSVIVPVPVPMPAPMRAAKGGKAPLNCATTVSCASSSVSPCTATATVLLVSPALKRSVTRLFSKDVV